MKKQKLLVISASLLACLCVSCASGDSSSSASKTSSSISSSDVSSISSSSESSSSSIQGDLKQASITGFKKFGYGIDDISVVMKVADSLISSSTLITEGSLVTVSITGFAQTASSSFYLYVGDQVILSTRDGDTLSFEFSMPGYDVSLVLAPTLATPSETGRSVTLNVPEEHIVVYGYREGDKYDLSKGFSLHYEYDGLGYLPGFTATYSTSGAASSDCYSISEDEFYLAGQDYEGDVTINITCEYKGVSTISFDETSAALIKSIAGSESFETTFDATIGSTVLIEDIIPDSTDDNKFAFSSASITYGGTSYSSVGQNNILACTIRDGSIEFIKFTMPSSDVVVSLNTVAYHTVSFINDETHASKIKSSMIKDENVYSSEEVNSFVVDSLVYLWIEPEAGYVPSTLKINGEVLTKTDTANNTTITVEFAQNALHDEYYTISFNMPNSDAELEVVFTEETIQSTYSLTYTSSDENGNSIVFYKDSDDSEISSGDKIDSCTDFLTYYFIPTAVEGYEFNYLEVTYGSTTEEWSVSNGLLDLWSGKYYFKMPEQDISINAVFTQTSSLVTFTVSYDTAVYNLKVYMGGDGTSQNGTQYKKLQLNNKSFSFEKDTYIEFYQVTTSTSGKYVYVELTYADGSTRDIEPDSTSTSSFSGTTSVFNSMYQVEENLTALTFKVKNAA